MIFRCSGGNRVASDGDMRLSASISTVNQKRESQNSKVRGWIIDVKFVRQRGEVVLIPKNARLIESRSPSRAGESVGRNCGESEVSRKSSGVG